MEHFKKIVGDRIYLSPKGASQEETQKFTEWMNDFGVTDYTGKSRDAIFLNGKYYDKLQMDILESEFEGEYIRNKEIN